MLGLRLGVQSGMAGAGSAVSIPSFSRDFATVKTLNHGIGPDITYTRTGGSASYFDSSGVIQFVSAGTGAEYARFDHDPSTLESKGLLIEEGRTNSLSNSQMSGAITGSPGTAPTGWGLSGSVSGLTRTITSGSISGFNYIDVRFNGTLTGGPINLVFDPQSSTAGYTASSSQIWTGSCYFALTGGSFPESSTPKIRITERNSSNTSLANTDLSISSATSSIQRFSATRTLNQATTAKVTLDIRVDTIPDATAVDFTLRIAAPQLEQGAFATSYIPTTSAAVTRGADVATVTPISSFASPTGEETLFSEFSSYTFGPTSTFPRIVQLDEGSTGQTNRHNHYINQSTSRIGSGYYTNNVAQYDISSSYTLNSIRKTASGIASNNGMIAMDGLLLTGDTIITLRTTQNTHLQIGNSIGTSSFLDGHIRKIAYYPKRLSNERLRSLTV